MAGVTGLEPATSGLTGQRSNQLSYTPKMGIRLSGQRTGFYRPHPWLSSRAPCRALPFSDCPFLHAHNLRIYARTACCIEYHAL